MNFQRLYAVIVLLSLNCYAFAFQEEGKKLSFQGTLYENGQPVDGTRSFTFNIALDDGASWTETQTTIPVVEGFYAVTLGSNTPIPFDIFFNAEERQLTVSIDGTQVGNATIYAPFARKNKINETRLFTLDTETEPDSIAIEAKVFGSGKEFNAGIKSTASTDNSNTGLYGIANGGSNNFSEQIGVLGEIQGNGLPRSIGVMGINNSTGIPSNGSFGQRFGGFFEASGDGTGGSTRNMGILAFARGAENNVAVFAQVYPGPNNYAGHFTGNVKMINSELSVIGQNAKLELNGGGGIPNVRLSAVDGLGGLVEVIGTFDNGNGIPGLVEMEAAWEPTLFLEYGDLRVNSQDGQTKVRARGLNYGDLEIFGTATASALGDFQVVNGANGSQEARLTLNSSDGRSFTLTPDGISGSTGPIDPNPTFDNIQVNNSIIVNDPSNPNSDGLTIFSNGSVNGNIFRPKSLYINDEQGNPKIDLYYLAGRSYLNLKNENENYAQISPEGISFRNDNSGFVAADLSAGDEGGLNLYDPNGFRGSFFSRGIQIYNQNKLYFNLYTANRLGAAEFLDDQNRKTYVGADKISIENPSTNASYLSLDTRIDQNGIKGGRITLRSDDGGYFELTSDGLSSSPTLPQNPSFASIDVQQYIEVNDPNIPSQQGVRLSQNGLITASDYVGKSISLRDDNDEQRFSLNGGDFGNGSSVFMNLNDASQNQARILPTQFSLVRNNSEPLFNFFNSQGKPRGEIINWDDTREITILEGGKVRGGFDNSDGFELNYNFNDGAIFRMDHIGEFNIFSSAKQGIFSIERSPNSVLTGKIELGSTGLNLGTDASQSGFILNHEDNGGTRLDINWNNSSTFSFNSLIGNLEISGSLAQSSDRRLKKQIKTIDLNMEEIQALRGVTYAWKDQQRPQANIGFIAQEVEKIFPQLVVTKEDGYKAVKYAEMTAVLLEAIKQLDIRIDELELENKELTVENTRLEDIENKVNQLESLLLSIAQSNEPKN